MRVKETRRQMGMGAFGPEPRGTLQTRVTEIPDGSPVPEGAIEVPPETPLSDWVDVPPASAPAAQ